MLLTCPGCSKSFDSREPSRVGEMEVACPYCRALATVVTTVKISKAPQAPARPFLSPEKTVLVAVEGAATKEMIQEVLQRDGYAAVMASTGQQVLTTLEQSRPSIALLDVGLPEIMGFELCEKIKKSEQHRGIKIILVASIYDKKRYKREPDSLYGADDYIERHDIQDRLVFKIEELLGKRPATFKDPAIAPHPAPDPAKPVSAAGRPMVAPANQDSMFLEEATVYEPSLHTAKPGPRSSVTPLPFEPTKNSLEEATVYAPSLNIPKPALRPPAPSLPVETTKSPLEEATVYAPSLNIPKPAPRPPASPPVDTPKKQPVANDPKHEAAKRLARLILSDIGLYNTKAVEQGVRNNTFHQLLKNELEEGRKLYYSRVSADVAPDYYDQAIEEFIRKRRGGS